uniref:ABC-type glutathione-S-conjugate transporter n=1 Tax=Bursaphelenchus xylophilus TaxID=6326 RepID=A0A8T9JF39_BURXY|nr:multidrug resistance-associated protein [Bursaphelenchus xylophilus]
MGNLPDQFAFCADPLWISDEVAANNTLPILTFCFEHAVLAMVPVVYYFLLLPVLLFQIHLSEYPPLPDDYLFDMKSGVSFLLICDKTFLLVRSLWETYLIGETVPIIEYVYPSLHIITITVSALNSYRYIPYLIWYPLILIQTILHCFTLHHYTGIGNESPERQASFLSNQFFCWFSDIVKLGKKRALVSDDLYELDPIMQGDRLDLKWTSLWTKSYSDYMKKVDDSKQYREYESLHTVNDQTPLVGHKHERLLNYGSHGECRVPTNKEKPAPPSFIAILFHLFKWEFIGGSILKFITDLLQFANPLLLGQMITFTQDEKAPIWQGVGLAFLMFASAETRSILLNNYFTTMFRLGCKVQSVLTVAVYNKVLRLSNSARQKRTAGEIVNLMSIDVERFQTITPNLQQYWSSPLTIVIALVILFQTVGYSAFGGVFIMLLIIPLNLVIMVKTKKWQVEQMKLKDERLKLTNEVLNGIRVVKLYAWEKAMMDQINELRRAEVMLIRRAQLTRSIGDVLNVASPFLVALVAFTIFTLSSKGNILTPQVAFVSLTVFAQLRVPLFLIAELVGNTVQMIVSNRRLKEFLAEEEMDDNAIVRDLSSGYDRAIEVSLATFTWDKASPKASLKDIQLDIEKGSLVAIVGKVGSGKSSLLSALLGEMDKLDGFAGVRGSIAYVPQQSWIQNQSLKDNITFGKEWDEQLYNKVIEACELRRDFEFLPYGDQTEIGEKGVNLSGGQKARVSLARALYQETDLLLLDDPLSAVDAIVGATIFEKAIGPNSLTKNATRVLVTHSLACLPECDNIVVVKDGEIVRIDKFENLLADEEMSRLIKQIEQEEDEEVPVASGDSGNLEESDTDYSSTESDNRSKKERRVSKLSSRAGSRKKSIITPAKLVQDEVAQTGRVRPSIYMHYFKSMNLAFFLCFLLGMTVNTVLSVIRSFWLSAWSDEAGTDQMSLGVRLGVFGALGFGEVFAMYFATIFLILGSVNASIRLHAPLLYRIMRAPVVFFDVTPLGRILNRFGKEMETVDLRLNNLFRFLLVCILSVLSTITVISISSPIFLLFMFPLAIVYILILTYFIPTSRQLQRLSSISRSPLFAAFGETIQGVTSIRAYGVARRFYQGFLEKINLHVKCKYSSLVSARWLGMRLEIMGNTIILIAALLSVWSKETGFMSAGVIGMTLSYALNITNMLSMLVRQVSDVESNIVSVERIKEYTEIEEEAPWQMPEGSRIMLPREWPLAGAVSFKNVSTRYRRELELSLIDINLDIRPGEKIGVVGRTGAGKSSMVLTLFRLIEPTNGRILVDGVNLSMLGLHEIRSRFTIIPQEPTLFSGTLRLNLDPFHAYSDAELWRALEDANLKEFVQGLDLKLEHVIAEGGSNISVGQRQLICLARAILRKSKVVVLDEATASVDVQTDEIIQRTIREKFVGSTVITIAHRIRTILDSDRILVLKNGRMVEFDTPQKLLDNPKSLFYSLANTHKS